MKERARYVFWQQVRRWTLGLLAVWLVVNLGVPWFARELDRYSVMGFPLGYWLAGQGALFIYLALIAVYVAVMDRLEAALLRSTADAPPTVAGAPDGR
jgi:putative solute:sodium symporter small subunit